MLGKTAGRVRPNLRIEWLLVRIVYAGKSFDLPAPCFGVHPFGIALFANLERSVHIDFNETIFPDHPPTFIACRQVGAHRRADDHPLVPDNLGGDKADPKNVRIPVFLAKSQPFGEMSADNIPVEQGDLPAVLYQ